MFGVVLSSEEVLLQLKERLKKNSAKKMHDWKVKKIKIRKNSKVTEERKRK